MPFPAERPATYEDVLRVPPECVAQLIHGQLHTLPRPAMRHALAGSHLGVILERDHMAGNNKSDGWWILDEPEIHLARKQMVVVGIISRERPS
uniref:Uncharacterized protein n=1 Tax=Candidatus Kentrum sp. TUN TaxID=2126343 RepID=A0A450ZI08_9GAMM|nr:MAG: hypothetical protein BECKTUN1418F_GA0071002_101330 [Candidatus Kentron sp. TUN]VFK53390.1 MAG: hypothetical protein BECKTUN1418E_GA0071001_101530 [Candidatus Kentron sp. TUN]VFK56894.1 MAG: hypothetical protein BECKTUN1418D_GA0071000_10558 [Candidatus Kentron sp. TUN]